MEILVNKYKLGNSHHNSILEEISSKEGIVEKLIGFITITEEDRLKAGIYVGNEGREWIKRSALIISSPADLE